MKVIFTPYKNLRSIFLVILVLTLILGILLPNMTFAFTDLTPQQRCADNDINYKEATRLAKRIKKAVENGNKEALANMMHYPLRINTTKLIEKKSISSTRKENYNPKQIYEALFIQSKHEFLKKYNEIILPLWSEKIKKYPANVSCTYEGGSAFFGLVWFHGYPVKILVINQPN